MTTENTPPASPAPNAAPRKRSWLRISVVINLVIVGMIALGIAGAVLIRESDTNPSFCGSCHVMEHNVQSYLTSNNLDSMHRQAGVQCKECHDYPVDAEIMGGIRYVTNTYEVTDDGRIPKQEYTDEMCLQCHISDEYLVNATDFLYYNPHLSHWGELECRECHFSHEPQYNLCAECHLFTRQRLTGDPVIPREENPWADPSRPRPNAVRSTN